MTKKELLHWVAMLPDDAVILLATGSGTLSEIRLSEKTRVYLQGRAMTRLLNDAIGAVQLVREVCPDEPIEIIKGHARVLLFGLPEYRCWPYTHNTHTRAIATVRAVANAVDFAATLPDYLMWAAPILVEPQTRT